MAGAASVRVHPAAAQAVGAGRTAVVRARITNVVQRASARADELTAEEYREGGRLLALKVARLRPRWLAVVGVTAYRAAFDDKKAQVGPQERTIGDTRVWVLPNPSGLNAHWTAQTMAEEFARLRSRRSRTRRRSRRSRGHGGASWVTTASNCTSSLSSASATATATSGLSPRPPTGVPGAHGR
ncbi:mismatch-specific DNA-glycosylase [Streptomyces parvulus]|nr:mismatch-specific DNA-glycosylase [Streptomyces parvulus]